MFSAEVVDEQGTTIEATFWREAADHAYELLEEGKVHSEPTAHQLCWPTLTRPDHVVGGRLHLFEMLAH